MRIHAAFFVGLGAVLGECWENKLILLLFKNKQIKLTTQTSWAFNSGINSVLFEFGGFNFTSYVRGSRNEVRRGQDDDEETEKGRERK